MILRGS